MSEPMNDTSLWTQTAAERCVTIQRRLDHTDAEIAKMNHRMVVLVGLKDQYTADLAQAMEEAANAEHVG